MGLRFIGGGGSPSTLFIGAEAFTVASGTPAITVVSNVPGWDFDAAADEFIRVAFHVPADWTNATIQASWFNGGAGSGAVVWRTRFGYVGASAVNNGTSQDQTVTAEAQNNPSLSQIGTTHALTTSFGGAPLPQVLELGRRGSSGADTLANDAHLIGVYITKA